MDKAIDLAAHAVRHGWSVLIEQGLDTGGSRWVTTEGRRGGNQAGRFRATWHTRDTGTYRLFSCISGANKADWSDTSLKKLNAYIEEAPSAPDS